MKEMKRVVMLLMLVVFQLSVSAGSYLVVSPDGSIKVDVKLEEGRLYYELFKVGERLISKSELDFETDVFGLTGFEEVRETRHSSGVDEYKPYWGIVNQIDEAYNQLNLEFSTGLNVEFRAYDGGIAWRYVYEFDEEFVVKDELAEFNLSKESVVYFPEADGFSTPFESNYIPYSVGSIQEEMFGISPLLVKVPGGVVMVITEVNLKSYPGMFMNFNDRGLRAVFPKYPKVEKEQILGRLRLVNTPQFSKKMVKREEDYIAHCEGKTAFPWRAILLESNEIELLSNNLVTALAEKPEKRKDYSWVKPGKVVWDWYHKWNLQGVDFESGINTDTYKYMIDFAVENNLQYVNIDDGWCGLHDFRKINKALDLTEVMDYADSKHIGIFLWCTWQTLEEDLEENLDYFKSLGASGLKVDFFDRADQLVVDFVNLLGLECSERQLLLNLHGMYKPTGLQVTYPNMVNFEGILGLEYNKFSDKCTPVHNATVVFTRNVVGPMDYTPGGMRYVEEKDFKKSWSNPHVMTTKAQQMAMYVVFHGGVQMLADSPTLYEQDETALSYLSKVPVTWDETVPVEGKIGEYVVVARRRGDDWFLAGFNSGKEKEYSIKMDFLPEGEYSLELLRDGDSAEELVSSQQDINGGTILFVKTRVAGGFVARISPGH